MHPLLSIRNLSIAFKHGNARVTVAVIDELHLEKGRTLALVGESGSGKSVTALSLLQLLPKNAMVTGSILYNADGKQQVALNQLSSSEINKIRGDKISMIFQEPMTSLNPVLSCGEQVMETLIRHKKLSRKQARQKTIELFAQVELPEPSSIVNRYPHQLSGGQKQRVMIAMAISCDPDLLIADEPTTALDVQVQQSILDLLKKIQRDRNLAILLITHDLGLVADVADNIAIMYKAEIVEQGNAADVLNNPREAYTKALLACRPAANPKGKKLPVLADFFISAQQPAFTTFTASTATRNPPKPARNILSVEHLKISFPVKKNFFGSATAFVNAVDDVTFDVKENEILGLVGKSGCGKTTLGRAILQLIKPTSGRILLNGQDINHLPPADLRKARKDLQIVFQDPYGSLNPRISIGEAMMEPLKVHQIEQNANRRKERVVGLLERVKLEADHFHRYPHQFSGGQRQRICIARALALEPSFLLFDESVSALDVSVQAQVLNLVNELKAELSFTAIFISHDLAVVHYISDRILVMEDGKIVESGTAGQVYNSPQNKYTQALVAAIPGKKLGSDGLYNGYA